MAAFAKLWTVDPTDNLQRWVGDGSQDGWQAKTVPAAFAHKLQLHRDAVLLRYKATKSQEHWDDWSWDRYHREIRRIASALLGLGFQRHDAVSILGGNSPEWFVATFGAIFAGGMAAGVYPSNSADGLQYIISHSRSRVLFVDSEAQLAKGLVASKLCPSLQRIVLWGLEQASAPQDASVLRWDDFRLAPPHGELEARMAAQRPGDACWLSYTSGTTGNPKAVMVSHDAALFGFRSWFTHGWQGLDMGLEERTVSYLPCSHIGGSVDIFAPLARDDHHHSTIYFAFPDALQGSLTTTLLDVLPTCFAAVPRIWQKLEAVMRQAQKQGASSHEARATVGLQHGKWFLSGSAPIELETLDYFKSLGMRIDEIYGMTETNVSLMGNVNYGGVGTVGCAVIPGSVRLDQDAGEICVRHRGLMMGYMYDAAKTQETIDADGWLHSGDLGKQDAAGNYSITGRIKELIITAGGENIPPVPIEFALKDFLPCISNAVVVGDGQKMLVCLFTPKLEPNPSGDPMWLPELALESKDVDPAARTGQDAQSSQRWREALARGVDRYNAEKALSRAQNIRKFALLPIDFVHGTPDSELTPTLKLKRNMVIEKYADVIKELYGHEYRQSRL